MGKRCSPLRPVFSPREAGSLRASWVTRGWLTRCCRVTEQVLGERVDLSRQRDVVVDGSVVGDEAGVVIVSVV